MKKKILFGSLSMLLLGNLSLAQNWAVGGNALAGPGLFGTTTNERVSFITNGLERGRITTGGLFGFGITNPTARVHINSGAGTNPFQVNVAGTAALLVTGANSRVGIGTAGPLARLHINSAAAEDGLRIQINGTTRLIVHNNGGTAIGSNTTPPATGLFVSGSAGIGTSAPDVKLHVVGGTDAEPGSGGFIVSGNISGENIAIDNNEIMARNNGAASTLFLNNDGGDLNVSAGALVVSGATNNVSLGGTLDVAGSLVSFGSIEALSDVGANTIGSNSDFVPTTDGTRSLGTSTNRWQDVWAVDGSINTSDLRDKNNIRDLNYGLKEILQLRSIRFDWKTNPASGEKLGLVAQELQKVLPEVVRDWEYKVNEQTGQREKVASARLGVMYNDIIPVLIRGMQEQQQIIQNQRKEINDFKDRLAKLEAAVNAVSSNNISSKSINASLQQNQPNPFNQTTTIRYAIPQGVNAQIMIYDASGRLMKTLQATQSGQAQITAGELKPGTYQYALMVNGTVVANKTMMLLK